MRIGIDAHVLGKKKGGVETYLRNLILSLARIDATNTYVIYVDRHHALDAAAFPSRFRFRVTPTSNPWYQRPLLGMYYRLDRLDLLHVQRALPPFGCARHVLHVHDVMYSSHPELFDSVAHRAREYLFRRSAERSRCIVTVSEASRRDILEHYRVSPEKVHLAPGGIDHDAFYVDRDGDARRTLHERYGISGDFVLYAGALEKNKNVHGVIRAFAELTQQPHSTPITLVIAGGARDGVGREYERELRRLAGELDLTPKVLFVGYVPRADLRRLMSGARLFVFPSFCEGYGLPPIEAMACGAPVVSARIPAVREVCGDAALLVDPADVHELAGAMARVVRDREIAGRLVACGLQHAAQFSWDRTAADVLRVYRHAVGREAA